MQTLSKYPQLAATSVSEAKGLDGGLFEALLLLHSVLVCCHMTLSDVNITHAVGDSDF